MNRDTFDRVMAAGFGIGAGLAILALVAFRQWTDPLAQLTAAACGVGFLVIGVASARRPQ